MEKRKLFKITWKHMIFIQAKSERLALRKFKELDFGRLNKECRNKFGIAGHSFGVIEKIEKI